MRSCPLLDRKHNTTQSTLISCNTDLQWCHTNGSAACYFFLHFHFSMKKNKKIIQGLTWFWFCCPLLAAPGWEQLTAAGVPRLCRGPAWWRDAPRGGSQMDVPRSPLSDTWQPQKQREHFRHTKKCLFKSERIKQLRRNHWVTWAS